MLWLFDRPGDIAWTLSGAGAAFVNSADYLCDGRPQLPTRLTWLTGTQTTASVLRLRGLWSDAIVARGAGLTGLTLPAGTLVKVVGKRPADMGYTYALGGNAAAGDRTVLRDGAVAVWFVFDAGLDAIEGIEIQIYNNVDGVASIGAAAYVDIGEAFVGKGLYRVEDGVGSTELVDPMQSKRGTFAQPTHDHDQPYRRTVVALSPLTRAQAYGDGTETEPSLAELVASLKRARPCVVIPRWRSADGSAIDTTWLQDTAQFGYCTSLGKNLHLGGDQFSREMTFEESPS